MQHREHMQGEYGRHDSLSKSQVWRTKEKADEVEATSVNMVFILPMEFKAPSDEDTEQAVAVVLRSCTSHV